MNMLIRGAIGTGKTKFLQEKYIELIKNGAKISEILVLCHSSFLRDKWLKKLKKYSISGKTPQVQTFNGVAYNAILNYWPVFENLIPSFYGEAAIIPELTGVNISSYLLKKNLERADFAEYQTSQNLIHQLLRRYTLICNNSLSEEEVSQKSQLLQENFTKESARVLAYMKNDMLKFRAFDYLRQTEAFMNLFLESKINPFEGVKYLLVDDFDEITYQGFLFVKKLHSMVDEAWIAFDADGGAKRGYLCAYPDGWKAFDDEILELGDKDCFIEKFFSKHASPLSDVAFVEDVQFVDMVESVFSKILELLKKVEKMSDICVVLPENNAIVEGNFFDFFAKKNIKYQYLSGTKRLYGNDIVFALVFVLTLNHKEWGIRLSEKEWKHFLMHILKVPLELALLIVKQQNLKNKELKNIENTSYQEFLEFVEELKTQNLSFYDEIFYIFKQFLMKKCHFSTILSFQDFSSFNQMLALLQDFELMHKNSPDIPYGEWVLQIKGSVVADNPIMQNEILDDAIVVSTPQKLIDSEFSSKYQIWFDAKNPNWMKDDIGLLYNSWVFQKDFQDTEYSVLKNRELSLQKTAHFLRKLAHFSSKIYVFSSDFSLDGKENLGELLNFVKISPYNNTQTFQIIPRDDQKPVLDYKGGRLAVPAVPGAGKTTIMLALVLELIKNGANPSSILTLTYMDSAAKTFSRRIKDYATGLKEYPLISTIHGFAYKILSEGDNASRVGLGSDFEVCDDIKRSMILSKVCLEHLPAGENFEEWKDICAKNISKAKMLLLTPDLIIRKLNNPKDNQMKDFVKIYKDYEKNLRKRNLTDYDDLLILAVNLLENNKDVASYYQNKFLYVIEDEAQDSSFIQQKLIELLTKKHGNLIRTGDINQAIMSTFTNSDMQGFLNFINENPKVEMTSSQRCSKPVYELANGLVEWALSDSQYKNAFYDIKMTPTAKNPEGTVSFKSCDFPAEQDEFVVNEIKNIQKQHPDWSIAILIRNNFQARYWINLLEKNNIAVVSRADEISEKRVFKLVLSLLKFIQNPQSNKDFAKLAESFVRANIYQIDSNVIKFIKNAKESIFLRKEYFDIDVFQDKGFLAFWWDVFYFAQQSQFSIVRFIFNFGKYYFFGKNNSDMSNINLICSMVQRFEKSFKADYDKDAGLKDVIKYLEQIGKSHKVKYFDDESKKLANVEIMTIHKAKGDEFDAVFIPDFMDKIYKILIDKIEPRDINLLERQLEKLANRAYKSKYQLQKEEAFEGLRLLYVAITRAKRNLFFSAISNKASLDGFKLLYDISEGKKHANIGV